MEKSRLNQALSSLLTDRITSNYYGTRYSPPDLYNFCIETINLADPLPDHDYFRHREMRLILEEAFTLAIYSNNTNSQIVSITPSKKSNALYDAEATLQDGTSRLIEVTRAIDGHAEHWRRQHSEQFGFSPCSGFVDDYKNAIDTKSQFIGKADDWGQTVQNDTDLILEAINKKKVTSDPFSSIWLVHTHHQLCSQLA